MPAVGTGLQAVMCTVMIGMSWSWGAGIPAIAQVTVFTAGGRWFARAGPVRRADRRRQRRGTGGGTARLVGRGTRCELTLDVALGPADAYATSASYRVW